MYKIYINQTKVILKPSTKIPNNAESTSSKLVVKYNGGVKQLLNYIDMFEKSGRIERLILHSPNYKKLKSDFKSLFNVVKAAGGLVVDEEGKILFIFRRGFWDLPKGKLDSGETKREAALREVEEETGVKGLQLISKLGVTKHSYRSKSKKRNIKKSYWYLMETKNQPLIPQEEEDITKAKWLTLDQFDEKSQVYKSILDVVKMYKKAKRKS